MGGAEGWGCLGWHRGCTEADHTGGGVAGRRAASKMERSGRGRKDTKMERGRQTEREGHFGVRGQCQSSFTDSAYRALFITIENTVSISLFSRLTDRK